MNSILFVQHTDPAAYPPLMRSALLLAEQGWKVHFIGVEAQGAARDLKFPVHPSISVDLLPQPSGGWKKFAGYASFLAQCRKEIRKDRPRLVYCSDLRSYPVGLWASSRAGVRTILHEHDPPPATGGGILMQVLRFARKMFARRATLVIDPQDERALLFVTETGCKPDRMRVVYNCPLRREIMSSSPDASRQKAGFALWYHGAFGSGQLPMAIIDALALLPEDVRLEAAGYETVGSKGYVEQMLERARELGVEARVRFHGAVPERADLLKLASRADIGVALFDTRFRNPMVGASNKPFDYLACGLPLLTNCTREWQDFFGDQGVSIGCRPEEPGDIVQAVLALRNDPASRRAMAERGRRLIETQWNYEVQFQKVLDALESDCAAGTGPIRAT